MKQYPSLHVNTEYSILESNITIDSLISFAKKNNLKELVITDHNTLFGVPEFVQKCKKENIKPIIGIDLDVETFRLIIIAKNNEGYKEISRLSSLVMTNNKINISDINLTNLYIIDHPRLGIVRKTGKVLNEKNFFSNDLNTINVNEANKLNENENLVILDFIRKDNRKISNNAFYKLIESNNLNAIKIIENSNVTFEEKINPLPKLNHFGKTSAQILKEIVEKNIYKIINKNNFNIYQKRLNKELKIIIDNNFCDYFYIIFDLINWLKNKDILVGPGRGSVGGSLIAFILGITEIDPIEHNLLFERFINPERISLPDIDIDIPDNKREEAINYLFKKYPKGNVSCILTLSKLGLKGSLRDAGRFLNFNTREIDEIIKNIKKETSLEQALKENSSFSSMIEKNEKNINLFKNAKIIEGLPRTFSTHAAGIVISENQIKDKVPIMLNQDGKLQTQYTMNYLEDFGLLKLDLLGLRNLNLLKEMKDKIYKKFGKKLDFSKLSLKNKSTLKIFNESDTKDIFQFESKGMRNTLKKIGVSNFEDIVAIIALFRPGPIKNIPLYIERKNNNNIPKVHPIYDEIVRDTKGIIIYQEQIMQIAQKFAGMSFGEADILRKAISKKNKELIIKLKEKFIYMSLKKGHTLEVISNIYSKIEKFANYGFNKSHAVSYAILSYRIAFIKAMFPSEFYSVILDNQPIREAKEYFNKLNYLGFDISLPNINLSKNNYIVKEKTFIMPFKIIKGLLKTTIEIILKQRNEKKYIDFFDVVKRLFQAGVDEEQLQILIEAKTLKKYGNIESLKATLPIFIRFIKLTSNSKKEFNSLKPEIIQKETNKNIEMQAEKKVFGLLIESFPTKEYENKKRLIDLKDNDITWLPIFLEGKKEMTDNRGNKYGIYSVSDSSKKIDLFIFGNIYEQIKETKIGSILKANIKAKIYKENLSYNLNKSWEVIENE